MMETVCVRQVLHVGDKLKGIGRIRMTYKT